MNKKILLGVAGLAQSGKDTVADYLVKNYNFSKVALADPIKRAAMEWWDFSEEALWGVSDLRNEPDTRYPLGYLIGSAVICTEEGLLNNQPGIITCRAADDCWCVKFDFGSSKFVCLESNLKLVTPFLTPRTCLQQIGTEGARTVDPKVWTRLGLKAAKQLLKGSCKYNRVKGNLESEENCDGVAFSDVRFEDEVDEILDAGGFVVRLKRPNTGLTGKAGEHSSEAGQANIPDSKFSAILDNTGTIKDLYIKVEEMIRKQIDETL